MVSEVPSSLQYEPALGRRILQGEFTDLTVGTYVRVRTSLLGGDPASAISSAHYFVEEAKVIHSLYTQWPPLIKQYLHDVGGLGPSELDAIDENLFGLLRLPSGRDFNRDLMWHVMQGHLEDFCLRASAPDPASALVALEDLRETWRQLKDRDGDYCYGLIQAVVDNMGESAIGGMWEHVLGPLFAWRYAKFDIRVRPWNESIDLLVEVACESMRGHLTGTDRTGEFELEELEDRFVLRFDPCGSGGRIVRGDPIEGTPSRMEEPYGWTVSEEPHPWNHSQKGICHYCTHCIRVMEEMPIDQFGYPLRIVDPPIYPDNDPAKPQKCQWQMFKDPAQVPAEYYERVGRQKPKQLPIRPPSSASSSEVGNLPAGG